MEETNETLCIGIDLGTSRSSISASNGERHVVDSYVGWPLDMIHAITPILCPRPPASMLLCLTSWRARP